MYGLDIFLREVVCFLFGFVVVLLLLLSMTKNIK